MAIELPSTKCWLRVNMQAILVVTWYRDGGVLVAQRLKKKKKMRQHYDLSFKLARKYSLEHYLL